MFAWFGGNNATNIQPAGATLVPVFAMVNCTVKRPSKGIALVIYTTRFGKPESAGILFVAVYVVLGTTCLPVGRVVVFVAGVFVATVFVAVEAEDAGSTIVVAVLFVAIELSESLFAETLTVTAACSAPVKVGVSCTVSVALVKLNAVSQGTFVDVPESVGAYRERPVAQEYEMR